MKGLLLSLATFACYVLSTMVLSHVLRPRRHGRLLLFPIFGWIPVYVAAFLLTPADLGFLERPWMVTSRGLDLAYGLVVYLLNCHSYFDFFFGFNGGFSMSLLLEIARAGKDGIPTPDLAAGYFTADGLDKIYGWRLPRLQETGYLRIEPATGCCQLTPKGIATARLALALKRMLNLGAGG